jgi:hypothetical protein
MYVFIVVTGNSAVGPLHSCRATKHLVLLLTIATIATTLQVCVCILALVILQTNRVSSAPHYIVSCGLSGCSKLFDIIS